MGVDVGRVTKSETADAGTQGRGSGTAVIEAFVIGVPNWLMRREAR
jgi:predicted RNA-binding protein with TRAM domain